MNEPVENLTEEAVALLRELIRYPSPSGGETKTAEVLSRFAEDHRVIPERKHNNILIKNRYFDPEKPTILLNSHHDTVKPGSGWMSDPWTPVLEEGRITGLGSNDAGASLVSLLVLFLYFFNREDLKYNLIYLATAEEESTGAKGMSAMVPEIEFADFAIVGEPTGMQMAVAEKGLIVMECAALGRTGHAARDTGENAIYKALEDISWLAGYRFPRVSDVLGPVKMTVTMIKAGSQHNVVPDLCTFTVDIRSTDAYTNEEIVEIIRDHISSDITRCSLRLNPSSINRDHKLVSAAQELGLTLFGSPTLSDQALLPMPSVKIGPGQSERSHTPNEFIYVDEIREGITLYIKLLNRIL